jgi:hypothetical protein
MSNLVYQNYSNKCKGWTNPSSISLGPQITSLSGYHSPAGSTTIVTINGYNFYSYSQIVFGTLNPTVYFTNSTILQFYIPSYLTYGTYPIQVFNGSIGSNIVTYTLDDTSGLTKSEADTLYLSKVNTDTSTAPLTTFNGSIEVGTNGSSNQATFNVPVIANGGLTVGIPGVSGNFLTVNRKLIINDINNSGAGAGDFYYGNGGGINYISETSGTVHHSFSSTLGNMNTLHLQIETSETKIFNTLNYRGTKYFNKVNTISTDTPLEFPLEETCMITANGNVNITLPLINSPNQVGMTFIFRKTGSIANTITLLASSPNQIIVSGSITPAGSAGVLIDAATSIKFVILEPTAGDYTWVEY